MIEATFFSTQSKIDVVYDDNGKLMRLRAVGTKDDLIDFLSRIPEEVF